MKQVWVNAATCSCTAATTRGAALPTLTTAIPAPRSISELPSTSTSTPPPARSMNTGRVVPTPDDTVAERRGGGPRGGGARGVFPGDRVAALCSNSSAMLELHNGVPWAGAVLVPLNVRLSAEELEYILAHSGARLLVADDQFAA